MTMMITMRMRRVAVRVKAAEVRRKRERGRDSRGELAQVIRSPSARSQSWTRAEGTKPSPHPLRKTREETKIKRQEKNKDYYCTR
jgi:hypothetical protein